MSYQPNSTLNCRTNLHLNPLYLQSTYYNNSDMSSCSRFAVTLLVLAGIGCSIGWIVVNSQQSDNSSSPVTQRTCYDICGFSYYVQQYGRCCNGYSYYASCKYKQTCRDENDTQYSKIKTYLQIAFFICLGILIFYSICRCSNRARRARQYIYNPRPNNVPHNFVIIPQNQYQPPNLPDINASERLPGSIILRDSKNICAVCFEGYESDKAIQLDCGHIYHSHCIRSWVNKQDTCPLCREKV